jgi:hypothetical protein
MTDFLDHSPTPTEPLSVQDKKKVRDRYLPYEEAHRFAIDLHIKSRKEWRDYVKGKLPGKIKPQNLPAHPDGIYKTKGWQGWRQWLGTERPFHLN